jgi:alanyl-tRNA synthetase
MLGQQVFNSPDNHIFFKDECLEFNHRWLTEGLGIDPDEITYVEDVWAGGGNMGPSIEYFIRGMEVGNMVFMQYKTFHDGSREELDIKVIDVGIGLERVAWIYNGSPTSYQDTFQNAYTYVMSKLNVEYNNDIWEKFGPYSCTLNMDEVDDPEATWKQIADQIGQEVSEVKSAIKPIQEVYIILDHTRTILITISDGALPSNVGGGGNVRNILRRVFSILKRNGWWDKLGMEGLLEIFEQHKIDLAGIYGKFPEYKSFAGII